MGKIKVDGKYANLLSNLEKSDCVVFKPNHPVDLSHLKQIERNINNIVGSGGIKVSFDKNTKQGVIMKFNMKIQRNKRMKNGFNIL